MSRIVDSLLLNVRLRRRDRVDEFDDRLLADVGLTRREQHLKAQGYFLSALLGRGS